MTTLEKIIVALIVVAVCLLMYGNYRLTSEWEEHGKWKQGHHIYIRENHRAPWVHDPECSACK